MRRTGYGLAPWLPDGYLDEYETRLLGELDLWEGQCCPICGHFTGLDRAHIVRKGAGGRPKGESGPTVRLCRDCHRNLDESGNQALAVNKKTCAVHLLNQYRADRPPYERELVPGWRVKEIACEACRKEHPDECPSCYISRGW